MSIRLNQSGQNGFTLVEVLIALAVMAMGLLMAANLQTTAIAGNKNSSSMSVGTLLGQQALEQLQTYSSAADPSLTAGTHTAGTEVVNHPSLIPDTTFNGIVYTRQYSVATDSPTLGIRTITLNVQWSDKTSHQVTLVGRMVP
ncbi:MAG: prepilin-type N-terminal cleavage/methylation domain-containing protein [Nitrospirae bacterium]|nr:prepilin-type N-terminal cleavage/methylation domain-containing protein [Nitrospirota bacterium]